MHAISRRGFDNDIRKKKSALFYFQFLLLLISQTPLPRIRQISKQKGLYHQEHDRSVSGAQFSLNTCHQRENNEAEGKMPWATYNISNKIPVLGNQLDINTINTFHLLQDNRLELAVL